jgi:hypothetical protein
MKEWLVGQEVPSYSFPEPPTFSATITDLSELSEASYFAVPWEPSRLPGLVILMNAPMLGLKTAGSMVFSRHNTE